MSGNHDDGPQPPRSASDEIDRSNRLRRLGERLDHTGVGTQARSSRDSDPSAPPADPAGLGRAMRLSSEFIAGIIAGALLGWVVDRFAGTSPWGFIILMMLGFGAGIVNVVRAAGLMGKPRKRR